MADTMKSKVVAIGNTSTELLAAVADGTTLITMLMIGNVDGSNSATVELSINKNAAGDTVFVTGVEIDAGKILPVFNSETGKLVLEDNGTEDTLDATASAAGDLVAIISYIERT